MNLPRRKFLHLAAGIAAVPATARIARAQAYPTGPVRLIVGFPAGGTNDIHARLIAEWLSKQFGRSFVVDRLRAEALATLPLGIDAASVAGRGRAGALDRVAQIPARVPVPPWPHASTMIQWGQPSARAWLRLDWFAAPMRIVTKCLQNMTSGKCQKTSDTSNRSHD